MVVEKVVVALNVAGCVAVSDPLTYRFVVEALLAYKLPIVELAIFAILARSAFAQRTLVAAVAHVIHCETGS